MQPGRFSIKFVLEQKFSGLISMLILVANKERIYLHIKWNLDYKFYAHNSYK